MFGKKNNFEKCNTTRILSPNNGEWSRETLEEIKKTKQEIDNIDILYINKTPTWRKLKQKQLTNELRRLKLHYGAKLELSKRGDEHLYDRLF